SNFNWFGIMQHSGQGAMFSTQLAMLSVTVFKNVLNAFVSDHVVPKIAGNVLCAIVPENDPPLTVNHAEADSQCFQYRAIDLWVLKFGHGCRKEWLFPPSAAGAVYFRIRSGSRR